MTLKTPINIEKVVRAGCLVIMLRDGHYIPEDVIQGAVTAGKKAPDAGTAVRLAAEFVAQWEMMNIVERGDGEVVH